MANFSTSLDTALLKHILGVATYTPGTLQIALYTTNPTEPAGTGGVETTYTNYARVTVPSSAWGTPTGTATNSVSAINFAACGATGATITGWGIYDANSSTIPILSGPLGANLAVSNGITPSFSPSTLTITLG
jgi:hypothetical protein